MTHLPQKNRPERNDPRGELGLRPIINVAGTMTTLGASIVVPEAIEAMVRIMPEFVEIADLHQKASQVIARLTGADSGTVAACSSAGITMAIAACMTGTDMGKVEQLPYDGNVPIGNIPNSIGASGAAGIPFDTSQPGAGGTADGIPFDTSQPSAGGTADGIPFDTSQPSAGGTADGIPFETGQPRTGGTEVPLQVGHMVSYGAPITQAVRLTGARVIPIGDVTGARGYQLEAALSERTAAALYVVSHHVVDHGQIPLPDFAAICHERGVPVVVDAASEYDLRRFLDEGADLVIYSGHKFLGGPTSGIVAGRKDLVAAAYLQNFGICRGMKIGKEGIAGLIAMLEAWERRDHARVRAEEASHLALWRDRLADCPGVRTEIVPDPTDNPLDRLRLHIDPAVAGGAAQDLAKALAAGEPPIMVRGHLVEKGFFDLDPCNLHEGEAAIVADRLVATLAELRAAAT